MDQESALSIWQITDTCDIEVEVWVGQGETADTARLAALEIRKFTNGQINYATTEKKALAILDALTSFHHPLPSNEFTIVTDNQLMMHRKSSRTPTKKQVWSGAFIGHFWMTIRYKPGQWNYSAEA